MITTINTTGAEDARITVAFGALLGLGRNATAGEVKANVGDYIKTIVSTQERLAAQATIFAQYNNIAPLPPISPT